MCSIATWLYNTTQHYSLGVFATICYHQNGDLLMLFLLGPCALNIKFAQSLEIKWKWGRVRRWCQGGAIGWKQSRDSSSEQHIEMKRGTRDDKGTGMGEVRILKCGRFLTLTLFCFLPLPLDVCASSVQLAISLTTPPPSPGLMNSLRPSALLDLWPVRWAGHFLYLRTKLYAGLSRWRP